MAGRHQIPTYQVGNWEHYTLGEVLQEVTRSGREQIDWWANFTTHQYISRDDTRITLTANLVMPNEWKWDLPPLLNMFIMFPSKTNATIERIRQENIEHWKTKLPILVVRVAFAEFCRDGRTTTDGYTHIEIDEKP